MKKIIVPIIIAAVLGVGGGVAAVMLNRPAAVAADGERNTLEVKTGKYYHNGDKNSGMYFELTDNYLALRIDGDAHTKFKDALIEKGHPEEVADHSAKEVSVDYCAENPYVVSVFGTKKTPYQLMIHWTEGIEHEGGTVYGGTGFDYNGFDTIKMYPFGEFILVE